MISHFGKTVFAAICIGLWATGAWAANPAPAGPVTLNGNPTPSWATIQEGVDAATPGDTVNVAAGTYTGNVTITKAGLKIHGANVGIHAAVGTHPTATVGTRDDPGTETVITGTVAPLAAGIVLDGLKFEHDTDRNITAHAGATNVDGFTIRNCIFDWTVGDWPGYHTGHLELHGNYTNFTFEFNRLVADSLSSAILLQRNGDIGAYDYDGLTCQYNYISTYYEAIMWLAGPSLDNGVIKGNEISGDLDLGLTQLGACTFNIGEAGDLQFVDNEIHHVWHTVAQLGIDGGRIANNTWRDMAPYDDPEAPNYDGSASIMLWGGQWSTTVSTDVEITGNTFMYNSDVNGSDRPMAGIRLCPTKADGTTGTIDATTIHVHKNYFINLGSHDDSKAVRNDADPTKVLAATHNWWDTIRADQIADFIEGAANVTPYLFAPRGDLFVDDTAMGATVTQTIPYSDGTTTSPLVLACGFSMTNTETRPVVMGATGFATLQAALTGSLPGETIHIAAGTYNPVSTGWTLDQSLRLVGPQVGVDPTAGGARASEAVLNGSLSVDAGVPRTILGGLSTVYDAAFTTSVDLGADAKSVTLYQTILDCAVEPFSAVPSSSSGVVTSSSGMSDLTVYQNRFTGYRYAVTLNAAASDVVIDDNSFVTCLEALVAEGTTGLKIIDNEIEATAGLKFLAPATSNIGVVLTGNDFAGYPAKSFYDDWPADTEPADSFYWYVNLPDGQINGAEGHLNGRDNSFEGVAVAAMTGPEYVALQDMVLDRHDNGSYGLLVLADVGLVTASINPCDPDTYIDLSATVSPPTAGLTVSFSVVGGAPAGGAGEPAGNAVTNSSGVATLVNYKAAMRQGTYPIVASHGGSSDTATLTVTGNPGEAFEDIAIVVSGPATATAGVSGTYTYTAQAEDAYGTTWDATADVTAANGWSDSPSADGSWAGNVYTPKKAGPWRVTASLDDASGSTPVTVDHGPATGLIVRGPSSVEPGGTVTFTVFANDDYGNDWDASGALGLALSDAPANGTFAGVVYTAGIAGAVNINATLGALVSDPLNPFNLEVKVGDGNPGDALVFDPVKRAFLLGAQEVGVTGWYTLGNGTAATIKIEVTLDPAISAIASITEFDPDGAGAEVAVPAGATNEFEVRYIHNGTKFTVINQWSTVGGVTKKCEYVSGRRAAATTWITEVAADAALDDGVADGRLAGFYLRTVTVSDTNRIAQYFVESTLP